MSEIILNYDKTLEILFGPSRDKIRNELDRLGFSRKDIEEIFIPITILRNQIDVGHVTMTLFKPEFLNELYKYLYHLEAEFQKLLELVISKVKSGEYAFESKADLKPDSGLNKILDRLFETLKQHNSRYP